MDKINDKANRYEEMTRKYGDPWIWGIYFMLVLISIVETYSASSREVATMGVYMPIVKHCFFLLLGGIVLFFVHKIPYNNKAFLFGITVGLFVITLASLVYVQFFGEILNGARRSFRLFGISIQPSEFAKLAVVTSLSLILSRTQKQNGVSNIGMWGCVAVVGVFSLFTFKSGLTNFLLLVGISLIMMVVGGISFKKIGILLLAFSILGGGFKYINHINEQKEENIQLAAKQNGERVINEGEATEEAYLTAEQPAKSKEIDRSNLRKKRLHDCGTTIRWCIAASTIKTRRKCSHAWRKPMAALRACSSAIRARAAVCHWRSATISSPSSWRTPDLSAALVWCCSTCSCSLARQ
ncbi:MAG: FtsW/RodA/SpoVE family cell cycle protein [Muribaculaceae bacterium]|nr:FtsW/RodA/SpoVE family cell cycle protein [Muribaculaceae bacterium]